MTRAYIYTSLPSLMSSFKIASLGDVIGTVQQDRATAIAGTLGTGPRGHPDQPHARVRRAGRTRARSTTPSSTISCSRRCSTYVALFNTLGSYERQFGAVTFTVKGKAASRSTPT